MFCIFLERCDHFVHISETFGDRQTLVMCYGNANLGQTVIFSLFLDGEVLFFFCPLVLPEVYYIENLQGRHLGSLFLS